MDMVNIIAVVILIEALIEYTKTVINSFETGDYKTFRTQLASIVIGVAGCILFHTNAFTGFDVNPVVGTVITGIIASRGANYASDLLGKITG